jgi:GNAT superfamily N-acetyltransferase
MHIEYTTTKTLSEEDTNTLKAFIASMSPESKVKAANARVDVLVEKMASASIAKDIDTGEIVGSSCAMTVGEDEYLRNHTELGHCLMQLGINLDDCIIPCLIYVSPDYRDNGIGDKLTKHRIQQNINDGFKYIIAYGYESQEIYDYSVRIGYHIETECSDFLGMPIFLRKLTDYVHTFPDLSTGET